jgi:predicted transglutaminase-like cysteine proteinase
MRQDRFGRFGARVQSATRLAVLLGVAVLELAGISLIVDVAEAKRSPVPSQAAILMSGGSANPTAGWTNFCHRYPAECTIDPNEPALISLSVAEWKAIVSINARVNASVNSVTDKEHWGVEDRWDFAEDGYGDCEDFQVVKRRLLVKAGLPHRALRMTVVIDSNGEGHAVLMVRTDQGDLILDNKKDAVLPWHRTGYVFVKREGSDGSAWASLGGRGSPVITANR